VDHHALLEGVVVDEADHLDVGVAPAVDLADGEHAGPPGADQEAPLAPAPPAAARPGALEALVEAAAQDPERHQPAEAEDGVHDHHRERDAPGLEASGTPRRSSRSGTAESAAAGEGAELAAGRCSARRRRRRPVRVRLTNCTITTTGSWIRARSR
jgi:hypothetical protein